MKVRIYTDTHVELGREVVWTMECEPNPELEAAGLPRDGDGAIVLSPEQIQGDAA